MTAAEITRLAAIAAEIAALLDEHQRILARTHAIDAGALEARPAETETRTISVGRAMQLADVDSPSTIYRWCDRYPHLGVKPAGGAWRIDERQLMHHLSTHARKRRKRRRNGEAG